MTAITSDMRGEIPGGASRMKALWTLFTLTLRQHLHGKRWMVMAVLFLLPAGLAILVRATAKDVPPMGLEFLLVFMFIPQALLPLVALLYASGVIQDEQEEQTLTYLLIRPISKPMLYLVKLLGAIVTAVVLTAIFTQLTYVAVYYRTGADAQEIITRCIKAIGMHSLAVFAYCCLFGAMSLFTKRTLVVGIMYAAIFEGLLANLPLSIRLITIIYYTRLIAYRILSFVFVDQFGRRENIAAEAWQLDIANDPKLLEHPTLRTCVIVLVSASLVFMIVAAFLCSRREFHVKTPEKAEA